MFRLDNRICRTCYFLLNFVGLTALKMRCTGHGLNLLFSFEFCGNKVIEKRWFEVYVTLLFSFEFCMKKPHIWSTTLSINSCYFLLNFVAWFSVKRRAEAFADLLFSFEFCSLFSAPLASSQKTSLLFSFEFWEYRETIDYTTVINRQACYFLLNFDAACRVARCEYSEKHVLLFSFEFWPYTRRMWDIMSKQTCYFLLNFATATIKTRFGDIQATCYFLLNFVWRFKDNRHLRQRHDLAIFFWILLAGCTGLCSSVAVLELAIFFWILLV